MMDFDTRFFFYFGSLLMIWLMADNTVASVNLFQQNYPASADVEMSSLKNSVHSLNVSVLLFQVPIEPPMINMIWLVP